MIGIISSLTHLKYVLYSYKRSCHSHDDTIMHCCPHHLAQGVLLYCKYKLKFSNATLPILCLARYHLLRILCPPLAVLGMDPTTEL